MVNHDDPLALHEIVAVTESNKIEGAEKGIVPVQIVFCLEEKKIQLILRRHWPYFLDSPRSSRRRNSARSKLNLPSLRLSAKAFDINSNVGGACGEMVAFKGRHCLTLSWLRKTSNTRYLHPGQAFVRQRYLCPDYLYCARVSVLPCAFSVYQYIALQNDACERVRCKNISSARHCTERVRTS